MATSGVLTLIGSGRAALAATTVLKELTGHITVPGRAQFTTTTTPRRVMHAGWLAFGFLNSVQDGGTYASVTWWKYVDFETFDTILPVNLVFGDSLWWVMGSGVTMKATVYW